MGTCRTVMGVHRCASSKSDSLACIIQYHRTLAEPMEMYAVPCVETAAWLGARRELVTTATWRRAMGARQSVKWSAGICALAAMSRVEACVKPCVQMGYVLVWKDVTTATRWTGTGAARCACSRRGSHALSQCVVPHGVILYVVMEFCNLARNVMTETDGPLTDAVIRALSNAVGIVWAPCALGSAATGCEEAWRSAMMAILHQGMAAALSASWRLDSHAKARWVR